MTPEQRQHLEAYVRDRGREPVFVGRDKLFRLLEDNAQAARDGDVEGRTICLSGPPGIGKTAFLSAFRERHANAQHGILTVTVSATDLHSPAVVLKQIADSLPPPMRTVSDRLTGTLASWGLEMDSAGGRMLSLKPVRPPSTEFPWDLAERMCGKLFDKHGSIVVLVDEAHRLKATPGSDTNDLLLSLHEGQINYRCPVTVVCAGHSQAPDVLAPSISYRYATDNNQPMSVLDNGESRDYCERMFSYLGVEGADQQHAAASRWIARECGGWPHHLSNAMRAVAVEALRAETLEFDRLDGKRIGTELSRRRQQYYAARLEDKVGDTDEEIAELLDRPDAKPHANLTRVRQTAGEIILDSPRKHLFPQDDIAAVRNDWTAQVVNRGIISRSLAGQNWQCAIDNLKTYIKTGTHQMDEPFPD